MTALASAVSRGSGIGAIARVDRVRHQRLVLQPLPHRHRGERAASGRQRQRAGGAHRVRGAVGPHGHPALRGTVPRRVGAGVGLVGDAQRIVPDQRAGVIVEPRAVVGQAHQAAGVGPFRCHVHVVGPGVEVQRQLVGVAEAERRVPRLRAAARRAGHAHAQIQVAREVVVQSHAGDVAAGPEVELHQIRGIGVDGGGPVLHRRLGLVGQAEHRGAVLAKRRRGDGAVEERRLVPLRRRGHAAEAFVLRHVALVPIAQVFDSGVEQPGTAIAGIAHVVQRRPRTQIAEPLGARFVAGHACQTRAKFHDSGRDVGDRGSRFLRPHSAGGQKHGGDENHHSHGRYRVSDWPDGWFDPWICW